MESHRINTFKVGFMIYDSTTRELKTDQGKLLKKLRCPLHKEWSQLQIVSNDDSVRRCGSCRQPVVNLEGAIDTEAEQLFQRSPDCCVYIPPGAWNIRIEGFKEDRCPARKILAAKGEQEINEGVKNGFWPLVKRADIPSNASRWGAVYQNGETGEVQVIENVRRNISWPWKRVITPLGYYSGFHEDAIVEAYLLPSDIEVGERVFLSQVVARYGVYAYAIWDGTDFKIEEIFHYYRTLG